MRRRMGRPGLVGTMARTAVVAGTATAVSNKVSQHGQEKAMEQQEAAAAAAPPPPPPPPMPAQAAPVEPVATSTDDMIEQIKKLGALKADGLLTDDEFAQQKARILAG